MLGKKIQKVKYYVRPKRAWEQMKAAWTARQTVYLYGATGTGKTSFVADFLDRKRYYYVSMSDTGIDEAAREIQERLENPREKTEQIIFAIDDLYLLEAQEERNTCEKLIEKLCVRKDVWLVLISRAPVPEWITSVYIRYIFVTIGEESLFLTEKEQECYLEKWELFPTEDACKRIWDLGHGNPLYLRIVAMRLRELPGKEALAEDRTEAELKAIEKSRKDIWNYYESYVYDQWNVELQEFLAAVSIVERFDLSMAQQLTKKKDVGRLIRQAQETGNFLLEHRKNEQSIYELRIPMKYSMRRCLSARYPQDYIKELYYSAGNSYEMEGNVKDALHMYEICHNEEGISRILINNMRKNPASGEYMELKHYYLVLPEEKIKQSVELMAGMSMLQSMLLNEEESERWYQELAVCAKEQTGGMKRAAEARLLYLDIGLPHRGIIRMTDLMKRAGLFLAERKTSLPEFSVTSNMPSMMNGGKDFCEWSRRDRELAKSIGKVVSFVLGKYGKGLVDLALAESFFEKGEDDYEVSALVGKGRMKAESGGKTEQVFVAVGILIWLSILNNHIEDAVDMLENFRQTAEQEAPRLLPNIRTLSVWMELYRGRIGEAHRWLGEAPKEDMEFITLERYRYLLKVRVYLAMGRKEKALLLLDKLRFYAEKMHRTYIGIEVQILTAVTMYRMGKDGWQEIMQEAVEKAEDYHFVRILTREGADLLELLKAGAIAWKDLEFKKQVMAECERMADFYPAYLKENQEGSILLTDKALKILRLQAEGLSVEKIADQMGLSQAGVKYYNRETYKKLGVNNKVAAVVAARNRGLL